MDSSICPYPIKQDIESVCTIPETQAMIQGMEGLSILALQFDPHVGGMYFWELSCKSLFTRISPWVIGVMRLKPVCRLGLQCCQEIILHFFF